jgi:hypothetical protein
MADYAALQEKLHKMLRHHGHPDERGAAWPRNWL